MASRFTRRTSKGELLMGNAEARAGRKLQPAVAKRCTFEGVVLQVQVAIKIEMIDERSKRRGRRVAKGSVAVTADEKPHAVRARGCDHAKRFIEADALHQLGVHGIKLRSERG